MLSEEDVAQQQDRLRIYRMNLSHLLMQAAQFGGETAAPLPIINNIRDAREHIPKLSLSPRDQITYFITLSMQSNENESK